MHWTSSSPLNSSPHRKTHRLLLLVHFPAANCRLWAGCQHPGISLASCHDMHLATGSSMPPYPCRWWVGPGGLLPVYAVPWLTSSFLLLSQHRTQNSNSTPSKCSEVHCRSLLADALKSYDPSGCGARGALSPRSGTPYLMPPPISTP